MDESEHQERLTELYLRMLSWEDPLTWEAEQREEWRLLCAEDGAQ